MIKAFKKLAGVGLACALALSMAPAAFAADSITKLPVTKTWANGDKVSAPDVTVTFTMTGVNGTGIEQGMPVRNAEGIPEIQATVNFTGVTENSKTDYFDLSGVVFPAGAGVYRFRVTETLPSGRSDIEQVPDEKGALFYLAQVFVDASGSIKAITVHRTDDGLTPKENEKVAEPGSTTGVPFTNKMKMPDQPDNPEGNYFTDFSVEKKVVDTENVLDDDAYFDFTIHLTGTTDYPDGKLFPITLPSGVQADTNHPAGQIKVGTDYKVKMKHGDKVNFSTLPAGMTVTVDESWESSFGTIDKAINFNNGTSALWTNNLVPTAPGATLEHNTAIVTNTVNYSAPTGLILQVAPFVVGLVLAVALGAVFVARKKKEQQLS